MESTPQPVQSSPSTPLPAVNHEPNTSGQYHNIDVPAEIRKWNWGAFFLNWIWGLGNSTYISLLMFVPFVNIAMPFVLGAKGSEWAWKHRHWESVAQFKKVQRQWAIAGLLVFVFITAVCTLMVVTLVHSFGNTQKPADTFFSELSSGQTELAYNGTAAAFQSSTSLSDFQAIVTASPILGQVTDESFDEVNITNNLGTLKGTVTGKNGIIFPITVSEIKEGGQWKVAGFHVGTTTADVSNDQ